MVVDETRQCLDRHLLKFIIALTIQLHYLWLILACERAAYVFIGRVIGAHQLRPAHCCLLCSAGFAAVSGSMIQRIRKQFEALSNDPHMREVARGTSVAFVLKVLGAGLAWPLLLM
jgi:hypothetical protein